MVIVLNLITWMIFCFVFYSFLIIPVSALSNAGFESGVYGEWFDLGSTDIGTTYAYSGTYGAMVKTPGSPASYIGQRITLGEWLSFERKLLDTSESDFVVSWQGTSPTGNSILRTESGTSGWSRIYIDTSHMSGYYGNLKFSGASYDVGFEVWLDDVSVSEFPPSTLSGYIKNTEGHPVRTYIDLNTSSETIESDDATGYYEFTDVESGSHLLTIDGFVYDDYSTVLAVNGPTEHNITLSRQLPILTVTNIYPEQYEMLLTWERNIVVSDVKVYRGTNTNLIGTAGSGSYLTGFYQDESVECGTIYDYWLQPMDDDVEGPKYALSDITDVCDVSAVPPIFTETPTPTETPVGNETDDGDEEEGLIGIIDEIVDNGIEELIEFFDESLIEPTKVIVEEVITHVTTTFNWLLLGFVYLSALAGRIINKGRNVFEVIVDMFLYGTLAVIFVLILSFIGFSFIFSNEMIAVVIFVVVGLGFGIIPEILKNEDLPGRS